MRLPSRAGLSAGARPGYPLSGGRAHIRHSDELACAARALILQLATVTYTITAVSVRKRQSPGGCIDG
jgi:hypothetical protein